jgi:hypothetical protein
MATDSPASALTRALEQNFMERAAEAFDADKLDSYIDQIDEDVRNGASSVELAYATLTFAARLATAKVRAHEKDRA